MPYESPGSRYSVVATKATHHGEPAEEHGFAGVAAKSAQVAPMVPSAANAALAVDIAIGEEFVIMCSGVHEVAASLISSPAVGDTLYIVQADNTLAKTSGAGKVKFGLIEDVSEASSRGVVRVNLNRRDSF